MAAISAEQAQTLEKNLSALAGRFPQLVEFLGGIELLPIEFFEGKPSTGSELHTGNSLRVFKTSSGDLSAEYQGAILHSAYRPREEAQRLAQTIAPLTDTVLVTHWGLGYLASAVQTLKTNLEHIIICEPDVQLFKTVLTLCNLFDVLADERVHFFFEAQADTILSVLEEIKGKKVTVLGMPTQSKDLNAKQEWYRHVKLAVDRYTQKENINLHTLKKFGHRWVKNLARNSWAYGELAGISKLVQTCSNLPALVVAAGPSLDAVLPHLQELRERFLIIAVDTALRSLLRVNIEPDFLVVVDPQYWNYCHLQGLQSPNTMLVADPVTWPRVLHFNCRKKFICSSLFPLSKEFEKLTEAKGELGAGGSVATSAWDLARQLGAREIVMVGLDLAFPHNNTHARASRFEQMSLATSTRLRPTSTHQAAALFSVTPLMLKSNSVELVRSDERMRLYAWWFESRLLRSDAPVTFNTSAGGLAIAGMAYKNISEFLNYPKIRSELDVILEQLTQLTCELPTRKNYNVQLCEIITHIMGKVSSALELTQQAQSILNKANSNSSEMQNILTQLDKIDHELRRDEVSSMLSFLMPPLEELIHTQAKDYQESFAQSEKIYRAILESAESHLKYLND